MHAGCPLITPNKEGDSPLHVAAVRGHYDIVRLLCESGVDLDSTNYVSGWSCVLICSTVTTHSVMFMCVHVCVCECGCICVCVCALFLAFCATQSYISNLFLDREKKK